MIDSDQSIYNGEWVDDKRNGEGTLSFDVKRTYIGQWQNDLRHG